MIPHLLELGIEKGLLMSSGEGMHSPLMTNEECMGICRQTAEAVL